jgi:hypothetical protein
LSALLHAPLIQFDAGDRILLGSRPVATAEMGGGPACDAPELFVVLAEVFGDGQCRFRYGALSAAHSLRHPSGVVC